jgi:phage tail-like protein
MYSTGYLHQQVRKVFGNVTGQSSYPDHSNQMIGKFQEDRSDLYKEFPMPTRRPHDHIGSSKFKVEIAGVTVGAFTALEGIEAVTEVVTYSDGDDLNVRKRPGRTTYSNIILKRGFTNSHELWDWYKLVIDGKVERKSGSIVVTGEDGSEITRYNFFEAWPCRWKSLVLDAKKPGTIIEELEIVVEKIERG